jgi:hypothetical protein
VGLTSCSWTWKCKRRAVVRRLVLILLPGPFWTVLVQHAGSENSRPRLSSHTVCLSSLSAATRAPSGLFVMLILFNHKSRSSMAQDRAQNAGMDGFLRKPYNRAELEELLSRWRPKDSETTPAST